MVKSLTPLEQTCRLRDTRKVKVSMQVQLEINRFCANTAFTYFACTMPLDHTCTAAAEHERQALSACAPRAAHGMVRRVRRLRVCEA